VKEGVEEKVKMGEYIWSIPCLICGEPLIEEGY
jgi:hypothetical protein